MNGYVISVHALGNPAANEALLTWIQMNGYVGYVSYVMSAYTRQQTRKRLQQSLLRRLRQLRQETWLRLVTSWLRLAVGRPPAPVLTVTSVTSVTSEKERLRVRIARPHTHTRAHTHATISEFRRNRRNQGQNRPPIRSGKGKSGYVKRRNQRRNRDVTSPKNLETPGFMTHKTTIKPSLSTLQQEFIPKITTSKRNTNKASTKPDRLGEKPVFRVAAQSDRV